MPKITWPSHFNLAVKSVALLSFGFFGLTACSSVKIPNIDLMGGSAFNDDIKNLDTSVPSVDEAPEAPMDVRSAEAWDISAKEMIEVRDGFNVPDEEYEQPSEEALKRRYEVLKNKAQAYKADDPQ